MRIEDIETPAVLIDLDLVEANIARAQAIFDQLSKGFRPHIKTHKIPSLARLQIKAGAIGIACQKISEAEVFAADGFEDILLCFNLLSPAKIARARVLAEAGILSTVADNAETIAALAKGMAGSTVPLRVLVECDTGMGRCGVQTPQQASELARLVAGSAGLMFGGLMTYPKPDAEAEVEAFLSTARDLIVADLGACPVISSGGTPSMEQAALAPSISEYRAGTYIYNDRSLVARGACQITDCALTVLTTVVSRPTPHRAVLDAGSKTLSSDLLGLQGYGMILEHPDAVIAGLNEEHGNVTLHGPAPRPKVGDKVRVVPNHSCVVSNLTDSVVFHRSGKVLRHEDVAARGRVV